MATTCAHVNMPAVCADKAWHYVLLSLGLSVRLWSTPGDLHKHKKRTCVFRGKLLMGSARSPLTNSSVRETSGKASDLW